MLADVLEIVGLTTEPTMSDEPIDSMLAVLVRKVIVELAMAREAQDESTPIAMRQDNTPQHNDLGEPA